MNLRARIKRLEDAAGKGWRHCAACRLTRRHEWIDPKQPKPPPEDVLKTKCEYCHSESTVSLANTPEEEREAFRLLYSATIEDQYTNPKVHALLLWLSFDPQLKKRKENRAKVSGPAKDDPNTRLRNKLQAELDKLIARKHKRLKAKYGDSPFPEHYQLIESVRERERHKRNPGVYVKGLFELEQAEIEQLIRAELEKIIWGEPRSETIGAIKNLAREIDELISTAEEAEARRKDERRRKDRDFLNNNRASVGLSPLPDDYGKSSYS